MQAAPAPGFRKSAKRDARRDSPPWLCAWGTASTATAPGDRPPEPCLEPLQRGRAKTALAELAQLPTTSFLHPSEPQMSRDVPQERRFSIDSASSSHLTSVRFLLLRPSRSHGGGDP